MPIYEASLDIVAEDKPECQGEIFNNKDILHTVAIFSNEKIAVWHPASV